jgi:hypothetical protein
MGIKETTDLFILLRECAEAIKAAKEDGAIDFRDLLSSEVRDMIPASIEAVRGSEKIALEVADLDAAEIKQIIDLAMVAGTALVAALLH